MDYGGYFEGIVGHEFQKQALWRAVCEGRVSHAYMFSGMEGIGKRLVATGFAKCLNCLELGRRKGEEIHEKCGCFSCKKIEKGVHPDVFLVEYEGVRDIKVNQVREEIEERIFLRPFEGRYKVAVIDEAERMNVSAQNAFLKTLEEPPVDSVIVLVTSRPEFLLPTIHSRCQRIEFKPLPFNLIREELVKRGLSNEEAHIASMLSGGSLGKAICIDRGLLTERKNIIEAICNLRTIRDISGISRVVEHVLGKGHLDNTERVSFFLQLIAFWLRDLMYVKIGVKEDQISNRDLLPVIKKAAGRFSLSGILEVLSFLEEAWYVIFRGNANKQIVLENLLVKIIDATGD